MNWFRFAAANLLLSPLSSAVNVLLMTLGTASIVLLILAGDRLSDTLARDARGLDLVVGAQGSPAQLILSAVYHADIPPGNIRLEDAEVWAEDSRVALAAPVSLGDSFRGFRIVGTTPAYLEFFGASVAEGEPWREPLQAVLGSAVARASGLRVGDEFSGTHGFSEDGHVHDEQAYRIVGILEPLGTVVDRLILTSLESVWELHGHGAHEGHDDDHEDSHEHGHEGDHEHGAKHDHESELESEHDHESGHEHEEAHTGHDSDHDHDDHHHESSETGAALHDEHADHDHDHGSEVSHLEDAANHEHTEHEHEHEHEHEDHDDHDHDAMSDHSVDADHSDHQHTDSDEHDHSDDPHHEHAHGASHDEHSQDLEVTALLLRYRTPLAATSLPREINSSSGLQAASPAMEIARILQLVGLGLEGLRAFAWVLIVTACLSVFAALYGSLRSRRGDLAMLRCLGATRLEVFFALMSEGMILSLIGIALGYGLGHTAISAVGGWLEASRGVSLSGAPWVPAEGQLLLVLLGVSVISAAIPAVQAYRTDVARTLAEEGR